MDSAMSPSLTFLGSLLEQRHQHDFWIQQEALAQAMSRALTTEDKDSAVAKFSEQRTAWAKAHGLTCFKRDHHHWFSWGIEALRFNHQRLANEILFDPGFTSRLQSESNLEGDSLMAMVYAAPLKIQVQDTRPSSSLNPLIELPGNAWPWFQRLHALGHELNYFEHYSPAHAWVEHCRSRFADESLDQAWAHDDLSSISSTASTGAPKRF
jgi:hypothetical protein